MRLVFSECRLMLNIVIQRNFRDRKIGQRQAREKVSNITKTDGAALTYSFPSLHDGDFPGFNTKKQRRWRTLWEWRSWFVLGTMYCFLRCFLRNNTTLVTVMDSRSMSRINWLIGSTGSLSLSLHCTSYKRVEWDWRIAWESRLSENASRHQRNFRLPYTPCLTRFMDARECVQAWEKVFQCNREEQITVGDDDHGWLLPLHRMGFHLLQFVDTSVRVSFPSLACSIAGWSGGCFIM